MPSTGKRMDIMFNDVTYEVSVVNSKVKKQVLKGVNGVFKCGELTAIMGPSGAGKSSLLNILTGFMRQGVEGEVNISYGSKKNSNLEKKKLCSYILQDDHLNSLFTVQESMLMAANLKIDNYTTEGKQKLIENILTTLNLNSTINTRCGQLSGGQQKRLSIALELLDNAPIIFLDEPTTGLDVVSSTDCIRLLKKLAREGRTIVCTIHQPSGVIYDLFDHVYVLADGHCVYQGTPLNTVSYLSYTVGLECPEYHNVADFLLDVVNGEYGNVTKELILAAKDEKWRQIILSSDEIMADTTNPALTVNENNNSVVKESVSFKCNHDLDIIRVPSEWKRLLVLIKRCQILLYRDWTVTHLKLVAHILVGILLGLFFTDSGVNASKSVSNMSFLFLNILYLWYTNLMPAALRFPLELNIIKKETFNQWYKIRTYVLAVTITSIPVQILFSSVFGIIAFYMTWQPWNPIVLMKYVTVLVLISITADSVGIWIGTLYEPVNGTFWGAILTAVQCVTGGLFVFFGHMPYFGYLLSYLAAMRYGYEGVVLSVYKTIQRSDYYCEEMYCHFKTSKIILQQLGMYDSSYILDVGMLIAQIIFFKLLGYYTLKRTLKV